MQFGSQDIFKNEDALREDWTPNELPEREDELEAIHNALAPASRGTTAHNLFLYGKAGQGKTVGVRKKTRELLQWADDEGVNLNVTWLSCQNITSSYSCACELVESFCGVNPNGHTPETVYDRLYEELEAKGGSTIIVLDEIDNLGTNDDILYNLPRARSNGDLEDARVSVIGISNDFGYVGNLSPKVKDTLCEKEVEFSPYNASDLRSILWRRVDVAFEGDVVNEEAVALCAAHAARDKGSARQAIRLLYEAGENALQADAGRVHEEHVEAAHDDLQMERVQEGIRNLTLHDQLALAAVAYLEAAGETPERTKHIYGKYTSVCSRTGTDSLGQRSVRDHLQDLSMQGFLDATHHTSGLQGGDYFSFKLTHSLPLVSSVLGEEQRLQNAGIIDAIENPRSVQSQL